MLQPPASRQRTPIVVAFLGAILLSVGCAKDRSPSLQPIETVLPLHYALLRDARYTGNVHLARERPAPDGSVIHDELDALLQAKVLGQERNGKIWLEITTSKIHLAWTPSVESRMGSTELATEIAERFEGMRLRLSVDPQGTVLDRPKTPTHFSNDQRDVLETLVRVLVGGTLYLPEQGLGPAPLVRRLDWTTAADESGKNTALHQESRIAGRTAQGEVRVIQRNDLRWRTASRSDGAEDRIRTELTGDFLAASGWWQQVDGTEINSAEKDSSLRYRLEWRQIQAGQANAPRFEIQAQILDPCHGDYVGPLTCAKQARIDDEGRKVPAPANSIPSSASGPASVTPPAENAATPQPATPTTPNPAPASQPQPSTPQESKNTQAAPK